MDLLTSFEIVATITGIVCVSLQAWEKIAAWAFGIVSVTLLAYVYYHSKLYSDFGLHIIYIFLNIYGWYVWSGKKESLDYSPILLLNIKQVLFYSTLTVLMSLALGYLMGTYTDADLYYFDAFTTSGSLVAQFLLAKKYIQNWLWWIIVDIVAVPIYIYKELYFVAFMFSVYLVICIIGYLSWKKTIAE